MAAPAAHAYTFGTPAVGAIGPETTTFDWSADKCDDNDIPDQPSRAYRDASGKVVLINSHFTVRRKVGDTLATVAQVCSPIAMSSGNNADPSRYDDKEWVASPYTTDGGTTVYALIHAEFQGYNHTPGYCIRSGESFTDKQKCWYNALTLAKSTNGGATFSHAAPPDHYVGGPAVPVLGRHRADRLLPAEQHRARQGRPLLRARARGGLRRAALRKLPVADGRPRRPAVLAGMGRHRLHRPVPRSLPVLLRPGRGRLRARCPGTGSARSRRA